ncbi:MAG: COX15/CtaA family protein [Owenweeksia sp.]
MKWIRLLTQIELVLIYLVILAGSVVRMTGSGMGCPDWPKCFGYLIPPTERSQLEWQPDHRFEEGQIIIVDESLRVAKSDFTTADTYQESNWEPYTKHNYALFNPAHTWTEYINRLVGALAGIPMFLLVVISLFHLRKNWRWFALSLGGLFLLGFEAWLGKLVVDGNLIPGSITIHMLGALAIVALLSILLKSVSTESSMPALSSNFKWVKVKINT